MSYAIPQRKYIHKDCGGKVTIILFADRLEEKWVCEKWVLSLSLFFSQKKDQLLQYQIFNGIAYW